MVLEQGSAATGEVGGQVKSSLKNAFTPWTQKELDQLHREFDKRPLEEIARDLGRTKSSVENTIFRYRIRHPIKEGQS